MFRIGQTDNTLVFPLTANYTKGVLQKKCGKGSIISTKAPGEPNFRYSTNWGSSWSHWTDYTGKNYNLTTQSWFGTNDQEWTGEHVLLNFWSKKVGSFDHVQHSDLGREN